MIRIIIMITIIIPLIILQKLVIVILRSDIVKEINFIYSFPSTSESTSRGEEILG